MSRPLALRLRALSITLAALLTTVVVIGAVGGYLLERPDNPAPSATGAFEGSWPGCVHLERWGTFAWQEVGFALDAGDAAEGRWDDRAASPADCAGFGMLDSLRLPDGAQPGIYRACGDHCVEIDFRP
jgi:hypothetical protein